MTNKIMFDSFTKSKAIELLNFEQAYSLTNDYIKYILSNTPKDIRMITSHLSEAMGKGVRAKLLLLCAMDNNSIVPKDAVCTAAAVELFHLATLVHDDVIDDSPLRRGIPTVQSKFGKKQAVICGDYVLCIALSIISEIAQKYSEDKVLSGLFPEFIDSMTKICLGEHLQSLNSGNIDITYKEYFKIISGKTAALFYISAYAGALLCKDLNAEKDEIQIRNLAKFGKYLGIIFQIMDDCKDYEFTQEDAQKPVNFDLNSGIITLPLILSLRSDAVMRDIAASSLQNTNLAASVLRSGGIDKAKKVAEGYYKKSLTYLKKGTNSKNKHELLLQILDKAYQSAKAF